jgi:hypothetical protein
MIFDVPIVDIVKMLVLVPILPFATFVGIWFRDKLRGKLLFRFGFPIYYLLSLTIVIGLQAFLSKEGVGDANERDLHSTLFTLVFLLECAISIAVLFSTLIAQRRKIASTDIGAPK